MDLQHLKYFISVAQHLNFCKAADQLYITQPGLSQGISRLEQHIGVKLFQRTRRSVQLTTAGAAFLKEAVEIIAKFEEAVNQARKIEANFSGDLCVGFLPSLGKVFLSQWVSDFRLKYPTVNLSIGLYTMAALHTDLQHGDLDIGYTRLFALQGSAEFTSRKIFTDTFSVVVRSDHPLADQPSVDLCALSREPFILLHQQEAPQSFQFVMQIFANRKMVPQIASSPNRVDSLFTLVESGLGVGIVPASNRTFDIPNLRFIEVQGEDAKFDVVLAWKATNSNPAIPLFMNLIKEHQ